jgi:hypothetical protein
MILCPQCAQANREGSLFCEDCGTSLTDEVVSATLPTRKLNSAAGDLAARATWGTARFGDNSTIIIRVRDVAEPIVLTPTRETVLGRADSSNPKQPDLDLSPFGALEKGVSRVHAVISRSEDTLTLVDMGSANGTHLNGQRLVPEQPRLLRDGDEIRLGKLVVHVYFK